MPVTYKSRLPEIAVSIDPRVSAATKSGAELIAEEAKGRTWSHRVAETTHVEFDGSADWKIVFGDREVFWAHFEEFGTTRAPAHPFAIPAKEAKNEEVVAMVAAALEKL
jgi:HK97 gp10 family phage protein